MKSPSGRSRLGVLAIALAGISVASYVASVASNNHAMLNPQAGADQLSGLALAVSITAAPASAAIGIAGVIRARRGSWSLGVAIVGLALGGVLTALIVIWFLGLILDPGALG